ncbi:hypothetical protein RND71_006380 [Anisodus tanguticus]|uniref:Uncharacterized protein n=1 Tax=Anisodus tanguticus TaxID=243964 RepID=A0AAE1SQR1_9SOLA|nr:hypothetical protein RND71_006380 [Anisodus tanguticus]
MTLRTLNFSDTKCSNFELNIYQKKKQGSPINFSSHIIVSLHISSTKHGSYEHHKEIKAVQGIKINAQVGTPICIRKNLVDIGRIESISAKKGQKVSIKGLNTGISFTNEELRLSTFAFPRARLGKSSTTWPALKSTNGIAKWKQRIHKHNGN